jgi:hypothetical protein
VLGCVETADDGDGFDELGAADGVDLGVGAAVGGFVCVVLSAEGAEGAKADPLEVAFGAETARRPSPVTSELHATEPRPTITPINTASALRRMTPLHSVSDGQPIRAARTRR